MIEEMKLGLTEQRIMDLFTLFDDDASGTIEPEEFVAILFPRARIEFATEDDEVDAKDLNITGVDSLDNGWVLKRGGSMEHLINVRNSRDRGEPGGRWGFDSQSSPGQATTAL